MLKSILLPLLSVSILYAILHFLCLLLDSSCVILTDRTLLNWVFWQLLGLFCLLCTSLTILSRSLSCCMSCTALLLVSVYDCLLFCFCTFCMLWKWPNLLDSLHARSCLGYGCGLAIFTFLPCLTVLFLFCPVFVAFCLLLISLLTASHHIWLETSYIKLIFYPRF